MPRLNERILNPPEKDQSTFVDLVGRVSSIDTDSVSRMREPDSLNSDWDWKMNDYQLPLSILKLPELSSADMGASFAATLKYVGHSKLSPLSMWVIANLDSEKGRNIFAQALEHLEMSRDARFAFLYNVKDEKVGK